MPKFEETCRHLSFALLVILIYINFRLIKCVSVEEDLTMTLREKQILDKFREQVTPLLFQNYMKSDIYLVRWLRARNFNINEAERMLKESIKWRKENKIDSIQSEDFADMLQDFPATVDTFDKEGRPVITVEMNNWDIRQAVISGRGPRLLRYESMVLEKGTSQIFEQQQRGMNVTQWICIMNAEGFNMIRHGCPACISYWIQLVNLLQSHFPGFVDEFIVIEATPAVNTMINILTPLISEQLRKSIRVFTNKQQWMVYLDQRISREQRRSPYGGTKPPVEKT